MNITVVTKPFSAPIKWNGLIFHKISSNFSILSGRKRWLSHTEPFVLRADSPLVIRLQWMTLSKKLSALISTRKHSSKLILQLTSFLSPSIKLTFRNSGFEIWWGVLLEYVVCFSIGLLFTQPRYNSNWAEIGHKNSSKSGWNAGKSGFFTFRLLALS